MADASLTPRADALPGNLVAVLEGLFDGSEILLLLVIEDPRRATREVDRVYQHSPSVVLPNFDSVPDALVFAGLHVPLSAAHVRPTRVPDRPMLSAVRSDVKSLSSAARALSHFRHRGSQSGDQKRAPTQSKPSEEASNG